MTAWLHLAKRHAIDMVFPPSCVSCRVDLLSSDREQVPGDTQLCRVCYRNVGLAKGPACLRCAASVPEFPEPVESCPSCRKQKLWFDRAVALGPYDGQLRKLALRMKSEVSETLAYSLGELLCRHLAEKFGTPTADVVVPIPMHPWRQIARGTNSAVALAGVVGRFFRLPVAPRLLKRSRNTPLQLGLSHRARFHNVRGGMAARTGYSLEAARVLLVDDILTTGATCSEAARVLKRAGAEQVTALVLARTTGH